MNTAETTPFLPIAAKKWHNGYGIRAEIAISIGAQRRAPSRTVPFSATLCHSARGPGRLIPTPQILARLREHVEHVRCCVRDERTHRLTRT